MLKRFCNSLNRRFLWFTVLCVCLPMLLVLLSTRGGIFYFSPDSLESRFHAERRLFIILTPIYRSGPQYYRFDLVEYLVEEGYWSPDTSREPRWLEMGCWNQQWRDGYSMLYRVLQTDGTRWIEWTEEHPEVAATVWPVVLRILREVPEAVDSGEVAQLIWRAGLSTDMEDWVEAIIGDPDFHPRTKELVRLGYERSNSDAVASP